MSDQSLSEAPKTWGRYDNIHMSAVAAILLVAVVVVLRSRRLIYHRFIIN